MTKLFSFAQRKSTQVLSLVIVILCLIAFGIIQGDALRGKTGLFPMQTAYTVDGMQAILAEWDDAGVQAYLDMMYVDFLFPLAYAFLLASAIARLSLANHEDSGSRQFLIPLVVGALDWVENIFHIFMLQQPAQLHPVPTLLAALAASAKWALLVVSLALVLLGILKWFEQRRKK